jgi:hypothetical protein
VHTRAQKALPAAGAGGEGHEGAAALRELFGELLQYPEVLRHLGEAIEGSDVRYPMPARGGRPHRLAGYLAPDLRVEGRDDGQTRVAELVRPARGVLLDLTPDAGVAGSAAGWADRVTVLAARGLNPPDHPAPADALLLRPDGYVAWATGPGAADPSGGLDEALRTWFGAPGGPP